MTILVVVYTFVSYCTTKHTYDVNLYAFNNPDNDIIRKVLPNVSYSFHSAKIVKVTSFF